MNSGDTTVLDTKVFLNNLTHGRQTVGGARRVGNQRFVDVIFEKLLVIAAQNHIQSALLFDGRRNDNLFDSFIKKRLQRGHFEEFTRAFHDHFNVGRNLHGLQIFVLRKLDRLAVNFNRIVVDALDILIPRAVHTVVLDEVGGALGAAHVVNVDNVQGGILPRVAQHETTDAAVAVQQAFGSHGRDCTVDNWWRTCLHS